MKKHACLWIVLLAIWTTGRALAEPVGTFTAIVGQADITSPNQTARAATKGDPVMEGDTIRTKAAGRAEITFADGSIIRIAPESRLQISSYLIHGKIANGKLDLFRGKVQSIVRKQMSRLFSRNANRYEIRTPTAICGVRGTDFFMYYIKGISGAVFREGKGYGYNIGMPDDILTIRSGEAMLVQSLSDLPFIRGVSEAEINLHLRDTEISATSEEGDPTASRMSKSASDLAEGETTSEKTDSSAAGLSSYFTGFMGTMGMADASRVRLFSYDIDIGAYEETETYFYQVDMENRAGGIRLPETGAFVSLTPDIDIPVGDLETRIDESWNLYVGDTPGYFMDGASAAGSIYISPMVNQVDWIRDLEWHKNDLYFAGTYAGTDGLTHDDWRLDLEFREIHTHRNFHFNGTRWSEGEIAADVMSAWINLRECLTAVGGGEMRGAYSEHNGVWSGIGRMVSMTTDVFLDMVDTRPGDMTTLNIPCVEIGRASLSGSGNNLDVHVEDVRFFRFSTGTDPALWATNHISGTFTAAPEVDMGIPLSGSGLNADFVLKTFDTDKWAAVITGGNGTLAGPDTGGLGIEFRGGAAGDVDAAAGAFNGSGSGIASSAE